MIEKILLDYLNENAGVKAFAEEPEKPPDSYLLTAKIGSYCEDHIRTAQIAVQSYAPTLSAAASLNVTLIRLMESFADLDIIVRCALNSDYVYADEAARRYRYQAVFDITYYD